MYTEFEFESEFGREWTRLTVTSFHSCAPYQAVNGLACDPVCKTCWGFNVCNV